MIQSEYEKGIFLQEFYGVTNIPELLDLDGNPSKFAEAAKYWGEPIPTSKMDVQQLVAKGVALTATSNLSISQKFSQNSIYGGRQKLSLVRPNQIKVPFVKTGAWKHDVYGEVEFTDNDLEELVTNFKNDVVGFTPYLTLGHLDEEPNSTDSHRKRGDLQDIIIENGIGFGIFDVSDEIYSAIEKQEFEYSSGEFNRSFTDKDTGDKKGTAVIRVALTNSPFLPFGEEKIQTLSNKGESCPEINESYVFLLSIDTPNSNVNKVSDEEVSTQDEIDNQTLSETVESEPDQDLDNNILLNTIKIMPNEKDQAVENQVSPATVENKEDTVTTPSLETSKVEVDVKDSDPMKTEKTSVESEKVSALASQLEKIQELYQTQLDVANNTIKELGEKLTVLTDKLAGQEKVTHAFSQSMSKAQEQALITNLQNGGLQRPTIQKFLTFKNAFESAENGNIVKFSVTTGEETKEIEQTVIDTVADLLISACNQTPLVEQQLGVSTGRKTGAFDFNSIIEKNKAAADKLGSK